MNNDEMRAALDAAKKYKVERVAEAEAAVRKLQADIASAEARLEAWRSMIPADVLRIMQDDSGREASNSAAAARARDKEALHAAALNEAYTQGKGILPPDNASKSTSFGLIGAMIFGMFTVLAVKLVFGVQSEIWLSAVGLLGALVGLFVGFAFFNANFVIDESLERSVFAKFSAHEIVRQTYFKRRGR